jgi:hypothetical protein
LAWAGTMSEGRTVSSFRISDIAILIIYFLLTSDCIVVVGVAVAVVVVVGVVVVGVVVVDDVVAGVPVKSIKNRSPLRQDGVSPPHMDAL